MSRHTTTHTHTMEEEHDGPDLLSRSLGSGPVRDRLLRLSAVATQYDILSLNKSISNSMEDMTTLVNQRLLEYVFGNTKRWKFKKQLYIKKIEAPVVKRLYTPRAADPVTIEIGYVEKKDDTDATWRNRLYTMQSAAINNGCLYICDEYSPLFPRFQSSGQPTMIIPAQPSAYRFYFNDSFGAPMASSTELNSIDTYDDPRLAAPSFPHTMWIVPLCTYINAHTRANPCRLVDAPTSSFRALLETDLSIMRINADRVDPLNFFSNDLEDPDMQRVIGEIRNAMMEYEEEDALPNIGTTTLNPEFVETYERLMIEAVDKFSGGVLVRSEFGKRLFATWAEASNFKFADDGKDMLIHITRHADPRV